MLLHVYLPVIEKPLLLGTGLIWISAVVMATFLIEPGDSRLSPTSGKDALRNALEPPEQRPETIDQKTFWNIIIGALADHVGSTALFPRCL